MRPWDTLSCLGCRPLGFDKGSEKRTAKLPVISCEGEKQLPSRELSADQWWYDWKTPVVRPRLKSDEK